MTAAETIDTLNLASNAISDIPSNCFHDLNVLNSLDLEGNSLKVLHPHSFQGVEGESLFCPLFLFIFIALCNLMRVERDTKREEENLVFVCVCHTEGSE